MNTNTLRIAVRAAELFITLVKEIIDWWEDAAGLDDQSEGAAHD